MGKGVKLIFEIRFLPIDPSVKFFEKIYNFVPIHFLKLEPSPIDPTWSPEHAHIWHIPKLSRVSIEEFPKSFSIIIIILSLSISQYKWNGNCRTFYKTNFGDSLLLTLLNLGVCHICAFSGGQVGSIGGGPNFRKWKGAEL